jgi:aminodeoxyfutalosine synthase
MTDTPTAPLDRQVDTIRRLVQDDALLPLVEPVLAGERLSFDDGLTLIESTDLLTVGRLADLRRRALHGDEVFFNHNRHINHTNICRIKCRFCAFSRTQETHDGAYAYSHDEMVEQALEAAQLGVTEIHVVGGEHPDITYEWYIELVRRMHEAVPHIHLKMWTASEIRHLGRLGGGLSDTQVLQDLVDAGLGSMPGGGAEVFSQRVRDLVCRGKDTAEEWLEVHRRAHEVGLQTNCTMLYGHVETLEERIDHLVRLRELQDESLATRAAFEAGGSLPTINRTGEVGAFQCFIPLAFHPENTVFARRGWAFTAGSDDLRMVAVSRLMLDNIPNVKAYWIMISPELAQVALHFGANDVDGTVMVERIVHMAGAKTQQETQQDTLVQLIRGAGRIPVERDTVYNELRRWEPQSPAGAR